MQLTEICLMLSIGFMVVISLFDNTQQSILDHKKSLIQAYAEGMLIIWLPVIFLLVHLVYSPLTLVSIGLKWNDSWQFLTSLGLLILVIFYFILSSLSLVKDEASQASLAKQITPLAWFMPKTKSQLAIFTLGLSVSAGICEELIFRGYLLHALTEHVGLSFAVLISSALFGLCHLYQGLDHVIRTFIIGLVLCGVYWFSQSLLMAIILHIAVDIYGGMTSYIVRHKMSKPCLKT
ncbi:CPBP family intramembrane metalloprotease [Paraglaciecola aquimarina]|uniref:CPBP family intramembrane metalloprotease n=1 Tax=Paraglaciecola algarum TaxID=3050085 RepID=A0ABS9D7S0_9ALTE|nr:type II CAAX endopeptidase family protein [Paraglaciecola sp. G1-23]MCF2949017.1 CPBP family intramembrane metalloprotease [Paraglaciecola sp. G1-23]